MLSPGERTTGWPMAEAMGDPHPAAGQPLVDHPRWDADAVRDASQPCVIETVGDLAAVVVLDETGCVQPGTTSVAVQPMPAAQAMRAHA